MTMSKFYFNQYKRDTPNKSVLDITAVERKLKLMQGNKTNHDHITCRGIRSVIWFGSLVDIFVVFHMLIIMEIMWPTSQIVIP